MRLLIILVLLGSAATVAQACPIEWYQHGYRDRSIALRSSVPGPGGLSDYFCPSPGNCVHPTARAADEVNPGFLVELMVIPACVIVLGILSRRRALERMAATVEPFAIASVDDLARSLRNHAVLALAVVATATSLAMNRHDLRIAALVASPLLAWATTLSIIRLWAAHRALQLIAHDDAIAEMRCDQVDIIARGQHAVLRTSPWLVQRAKERGVPRATL